MSLSPKDLGLDAVWYSGDELTKILKCSKTFIYEEVKAQKLRLTKQGRSSRFYAIDVAEYVSNLRDESAPAEANDG